jgi:hypothetical protein
MTEGWITMTGLQGWIAIFLLGVIAYEIERLRFEIAGKR